MQKSASAVASITSLVLWIWSSWNHNHHVHNPNCDLWTSCHLWTLNAHWTLVILQEVVCCMIQDQQNGCQVMMLQTCAGTRICLQPCHLKLWRLIEPSCVQWVCWREHSWLLADGFAACEDPIKDRKWTSLVVWSWKQLKYLLSHLGVGQ